MQNETHEIIIIGGGFADPAEVTALTRDRVIPGQGGECMGLGQIVGQCGVHKPAAQTPIEGLFLVGIDAGGGEGMRVHQSVHSAIKVSEQVSRDLHTGQ